ncbi:lipoprotein [Streptomyces ruber]|uniref:Lipoprotein n=2 Tax=Streptomyces TaxID=1883 RepID=A0A918B9E8_9ACTN|nr:hypothetical protein [Streptomyces ruber]GGQ40359.1 lipoprotein [Streptomyces ruber]
MTVRRREHGRRGTARPRTSPPAGGARPVHRVRVIGRGLLAAGVLAAVLTGCGIRATQVPTDAGPAPSRARCSLPATDTAAQSPSGVPAQVFLLCSRQLVSVARSVQVPEGPTDGERRVSVAQELLDELAERPSHTEDQTGYGTEVPSGLTVSGPREGDPDGALRLSTAPERLTRYALAQIVCTLAGSAAAGGDGSVVLGGPAPEPLRRYECTPGLRADPGSEQPPSTEVGTS